mmetsp:Transcript_3048/g.4669  ORF Transcript_3048/g.4669 Transcript_3048/m.4669 type:complete len:279 (+) Transcript_3048:969-1805(+)
MLKPTVVKMVRMNNNPAMRDDALLPPLSSILVAQGSVWDLEYGKEKNMGFLPRKLEIYGWAAWDEVWPYLWDCLKYEGTNRHVMVFTTPTLGELEERFAERKAGVMSKRILQSHQLKCYVYVPSENLEEEWIEKMEAKLKFPISEENALLFAIFCKSKPSEGARQQTPLLTQPSRNCTITHGKRQEELGKDTAIEERSSECRRGDEIAKEPSSNIVTSAKSSSSAITAHGSVDTSHQLKSTLPENSCSSSSSITPSVEVHSSTNAARDNSGKRPAWGK